MPLVPFMALEPFEKWRVYFVETIFPTSKNGIKHYILVATDYTTRRVEAHATKHYDAKTMSRFLYAIIISQYDCPKELINGRSTHS